MPSSASHISSGPPSVAPVAEGRARLGLLYLCEALGAAGSNPLMLTIFYYTQQHFGWSGRKNLLLAAAQGVVYVIGALLANPVAEKIGRRQLLRLAHIAMAVLSLIGLLMPNELVVLGVLMVYIVFSAAQWPALESLISSHGDPDVLARRIAIYNLVWSGTGALIVAVSGGIIARYPLGIFAIPLAAHCLALMALFSGPMRRNVPEKPASEVPHGAPEPELLEQREVAMHLARVALPVTFAVLYALGAMLPSLPVVQSFSPAMRTMVGSVWMIARWFSFVMLGATAWWHTRPRALLIATIIMLLSFLAITVRVSTLFPFAGLGNVSDGVVMIVAQVALGFSMGLIYCASLYFGMVLSQGSTETGSHHEALIGLGSILGPGIGALAQFAFPGNQNASIVGVSMILLVSVGVSTWVSFKRRPMQITPA